ncbi:hypothetical protein KF913_13160 [Candidatus Obscuribacterales bacterium]|nr:hypothetical protein [Candidatus Obscuribacterales bacterium]
MGRQEKELNLVVVDWQGLFFTRLFTSTGTVGGARPAYREFARISWLSRQEYAAFLRSDVVETSSARIDRITKPTEQVLPELKLISLNTGTSIASDDELPLFDRTGIRRKFIR